ncbi:MAG: hypothetical protein JSS56_14290 [Proteobacteria bacterium]|nr:hypothetical protein [Pseudomonadota bacterium]
MNVIFPALLRRTLAPIDIEHWLPMPTPRQRAAAAQRAVQGFIDEERCANEAMRINRSRHYSSCKRRRTSSWINSRFQPAR